MSNADLLSVLVQLGIVSVAVTLITQMFANWEERADKGNNRPGRILSAYLSFIRRIPRDLIALFWSGVAASTLYALGVFDLQGLDGWREWAAVFVLAALAYAVAAKVGHDLIINGIRDRFKQ